MWCLSFCQIDDASDQTETLARRTQTEGPLAVAVAGRSAHAERMDTSISSQTEVLDIDECWQLLGTVEVGRLAVAIMNVPDIFPINFVVDQHTVVFRTAEGTKLAAAVLGMGVAFEVDGYDATSGRAWSVVVRGHAMEIEEMYELFDARELLLFPWHSGSKHSFVRVVAQEITGRRFTAARTVLSQQG